VRVFAGGALTPEDPSERISASRIRRSLVSPKLVVKGLIKDMLSSRKMIASIFMSTCPIPKVVKYEKPRF
jgi:hypothetical protein